MVKKETVRVDAAQGAPEPQNKIEPLYRAANSEGSRVFFTSANDLTADATASGGGEDLYVFEVTSAAGVPLAGRLTDLSVDGNAEESAGVLGVIGSSGDGSYVYFVANGVFGDGAERGAKSGDCKGREEPQGTCNLYVEHYEGGAWAPPRFITALSNADYPTWSDGFGSGFQHMTSRVSPNGRYLAFMSERSLTGYENLDVSSGVPDEEVFLYDASAGRLVCASCNPTGARPAGC